MGGSRRGPGGPDHPLLENNKLLYVSLEVLVRTPLEKQLDPGVRLLLGGRSLWGKSGTPMKEIFQICK